MSKRRTKASATNAIQKLDALIQAGDWEAASEPALLLFKQYPTTPGVMERSMHVLRQVEQWQLLVDLLIEARNRYQLWPYGSDLLIGQSLVELEQWDQAIPYLQLALAQPEHAPWAHHFFGKALRHRPVSRKLLNTNASQRSSFRTSLGALRSRSAVDRAAADAARGAGAPGSPASPWKP